MKKYGFYYGALFGWTPSTKSWAVLSSSNILDIEETYIHAIPLRISRSFIDCNTHITYEFLQTSIWYFNRKDITWYDDMDTLLQDNFDKLLE